MRMKAGVFCIVFIVFGLAVGTAAQERPAFKPPRVSDLASHFPLKPNGEFVVSVWRDGAWREAGVLAYSRFVKEKSLDLSPHLAGAETARVRIAQRGGGAAHIDAVRLGSFSPDHVAGPEAERASSKLARLDHDLLDAAGRSYELTFPSVGPDSTLTLAARVEGLKIPTTPFRFPAANAFKDIGPSSRLYSYRLDSVAPPTADEEEPWRAAMKRDPFFKEYCSPSSGHPDGFTGGWVSNDAENLYVTLDFTSDNTCDGDKDYAAVHVRCGGEVKEFRVSEPEIRWGAAHFTVSDLAAYEHKVYEFVIPLGELGEAGRDGRLSLGFSAYGTSTSSQTAPKIAYCPDTNQYLIVACLTGPHDEDIVGFLLDDQGTVLGSLNICDTLGPQSRPDVAYDADSGRFLVVWQTYDEEWPELGYDIYGRLVNSDGSFYEDDFTIATGFDFQYDPAVANDSINHQFFVVWAEEYSGDYDILGVFVSTEGDVIGPSSADMSDGVRKLRPAGQGGKAADNGYYFIICDDEDRQQSPDVAFNADLGMYLVVFETVDSEEIFGLHGPRAQFRTQDGEYSRIGGKIVDDDGNFPEESDYFFEISDPAYYAVFPAVAADTVSGLFLVVWQDDYDYEGGIESAAQPLQWGGWQIYGRLVNDREALYPEDENLMISSSPPGNLWPAVAFDDVNENFLVVWKGQGDWNGSFYPDVILGQVVPFDGDLDPEEPDELLADMNVTYDAAPCLDFNSRCANFLAAWVLGGYDVYSVLYGPPCALGPDIPTVETSPVTDIGSTTATGGGKVTSDGGAAVTARGVCWSATGTPTLGDPHTSDGTGVGSFVSQLSGLAPLTTYFVRAYASNEAGTGYGQVVSFATLRQFTVTFIAGTGGVVTGQTVQTVPSGGDCTAVEAMAEPGYFFLNWTGTGGFAATSDNPLTVTNVLQDMTVTAHFGGLAFLAERLEESAWVVTRHYARLTITPEGLGNTSGARFVISRREGGGAYETIHEFAAADLEGGSYVYNDAFIEANVGYTYKVTAYDGEGRPLGASLEISL